MHHLINVKDVRAKMADHKASLNSELMPTLESKSLYVSNITPYITTENSLIMNLG